jgi:hypoxanthine-guanine phosphoribosyltransferase
MTAQVEADFKDEVPVFIGVLNGSLWLFLIL